nr:Rab family GTPase [Candidatus Sigynarchaeum springense]
MGKNWLLKITNEDLEALATVKMNVEETINKEKAKSIRYGERSSPDPFDYLDFSHYLTIITQLWKTPKDKPIFSEYFPDKEYVKTYLLYLNMQRNAFAGHSRGIITDENERKIEFYIQDFLSTMNKPRGMARSKKVIESTQIETLDRILRSLLDKVSDLVYLLVIDTEGDKILSKGKDEKLLADDGLFSTIQEILNPVIERMQKPGHFLYDTGKYGIQFVGAGDHANLISVMLNGSTQGDILPYACLCANKISRLLESLSVDPEIPLLNVADPDRISDTLRGQMKLIEFEPGDYIFKIVLAGDGAVGKTTLVERFVEQKFTEDYMATIGAGIMKKEYKLRGEDVTCQLSIWDLAGQDLFKRARKSYFNNTSAGILVFDVTRKETFKHVKTWMEEFKIVRKPIPIVLVGNKIDLEGAREVSKGEGEELAKELNLSYIETSAKEGSNVEEVFEMLAFILVKRGYSRTEIVDWSQTTAV